MKPSSATDEGMNQRDVNECCKYISDSLPHYATKAHEMLRRLKDCAYEGLNTPRSETVTPIGVKVLPMLWYRLEMAAHHFDKVEDEELAEACREAQRLVATPLSATATNDPGTEKMLRDMLDRAYKMMQMAGYRVAEQNPDHNNPIIAWMADARSVLYGGTKPHPDPENLT